MNHRVIGNALVGLHLQGDPSALARLIELSDSSDPHFRVAMAWCFGFIRDESTIPLLYRLSQDSSVVVRKRALRSLLALQPPE
jgi:HEAT repeat protein